jgi:phosphoglycerate dehydrogenase-like enzyme
MPKKDFSRRAFVTSASALQVAGATQAAAQQQQQAQNQERRPVVSQPYAGSASGRAPGDPIRVVTMYKFEPAEIEKIQKATGTKVEIIICANREEFRQKLRDAEVAYGNLNGADLDFAPRLKWIQWGAAGVEGMEEAVKAHPVVVTNYARTFAHGISETAMALLLSLTRGLAKYYMPQFAKRTMTPVGTSKSDHHQELVGLTMGIVGFGGIGSMIARRAYYGFDMKIVATDAKPIPKPHFVSELHDPSWFPKMVPMVDVLVAAAPSTPATRRMFNEQVFRSMKKSAYFLAMSRGDLFDDMALVKALKEGWIAGAGLDVMPQEPPPSTHPIFDCPNVVMSAHTSGWSTLRQVRLIDEFAENVRRYSEGVPLVNVVDKPKGY